MSYKFILLNSFDRSGSTLISKALAKHPKIENLFNPLNATIFRREFMNVWNPNIQSESQTQGKNMIDTVLRGDINKHTIKSRVFFPNSSTTSLEKGALHIIKTTNFHTKIKWFKFQYPNIPYWGLLRSPIGILASLVRNNFHNEWYGGWAFDSLLKNIEDFDISSCAKKEIKTLTDPIEQMAAIIGCLNHEMYNNLDKSFIIKYEDVIENPNNILNKFCNIFGLSNFDFEPFFRNTVNASGKPYTGEKEYLKLFSKTQIDRYNNIFNLIGDLGYKID